MQILIMFNIIKLIDKSTFAIGLRTLMRNIKKME